MQQHYVVLTLSGEYDMAHRSALRAEFEAVQGSENLVVDLSAVTFFDSSCIGELVTLHAARVSAGHPPIAVIQNKLIIERLFGLLGLDRVFNAVDSLDDVLPANGGAIVRQYSAGGDSRGSVTTNKSE